jgi:alkylation response protein AidB-like acyl-CoA dehydrogenase
MRRVLTARLGISELCLDAAQSALLHAGSRGYLQGSPVNRRLRESYFVAIITPSIRHLRRELAAMAPGAKVGP